MSRRLKNLMQVFTRSFAKKYDNGPKIVIVEQRKHNDEEQIESSYKKLGGSGIYNFSNHREVKSYNKYTPYEYKTRLDEKYLLEASTKTYCSPLQGYAVHEKPSRKQMSKQPTSKIVDNYYESIRQQKNASVSPSPKITGPSNSLKTALQLYAEKAKSFSNNEENYSHPTKYNDSTDIPTLQPISKCVKPSSEVSRLDDVHNENTVLKKEYGKGLMDIVEENGLKGASTKSSQQYLKIKTTSSPGDVDSLMTEFINRKDGNKNTVSNAGAVAKNKTTKIQKEIKKVEDLKVQKENVKVEDLKIQMENKKVEDLKIRMENKKVEDLKIQMENKKAEDLKIQKENKKVEDLKIQKENKKVENLKMSACKSAVALIDITYNPSEDIQ
ncbi:MATH and LRR domain-containing protein PFE0570w-like [Teleopsis dalmanni]|uniref:MATH and LRR domain-containing protein PFE0570w-like n=1 Tax=Teleopsis dalmanni TaxID=139649 RepID=UPI0018CCF1C0|nr:MATH and LRR domain-containing protein PFE0570w-like [Teleopsis dalmanni]